MSNWVQVKGIVKKGYGVASGKSGNPRFPQGTIEIQKPFFSELGVKLDQYFSGTINLSISPHEYEIINAKYTCKNLQWLPDNPAEDFSFFDCRIRRDTGEVLDGLIYYPHPETKPEHFQSADILEIITTYVNDLKYGDELILEVDSQQINIY
ncbi:hypothetical protein [Calothrix rhizosoleniae]|uniref:hypothetical protein n=1 Tax=Calothrix rhizosoleniae TaxID=888997 RepID=UPI000B4A2C90|nr:hypothetical protein [Calothrix rhizosoleniae]